MGFEIEPKNPTSHRLLHRSILVLVPNILRKPF